MLVTILNIVTSTAMFTFTSYQLNASVVPSLAVGIFN